ncbi:hypothetical protein PGTUg99_000473 [Puccinia graminis f. sp. tritici]|uniref:Uncharacterized protein n=1 Tax=Puccinia graminis f. sp. tritici TaxID=56615 RepID=A0A5B0PUC5_PUCGR|nr:hypothetical protein PGTUg99_000473 [Puccinia graminis f. sp. tritici]
MQSHPNPPNSSQLSQEPYSHSTPQYQNHEQSIGRITPDPVDPQVEMLSQYFQNQHQNTDTSLKSNNGQTYMDQCSPRFTIAQQKPPTGVILKNGTLIGNPHVAVSQLVKGLWYSWISSVKHFTSS